MVLLDPLYRPAKAACLTATGGVQSAAAGQSGTTLSDVKLAEMLDDRASFRCFCGFSANEATPERTAFVRFRRLLLAHRLDPPTRQARQSR
ncbi:MAG: transposase [Sphingobium sp.]|nr:transposase [Sphingobium sp.]